MCDASGRPPLQGQPAFPASTTHVWKAQSHSSILWLSTPSFSKMCVISPDVIDDLVSLQGLRPCKHPDLGLLCTFHPKIPSATTTPSQASPHGAKSQLYSSNKISAHPFRRQAFEETALGAVLAEMRGRGEVAVPGLAEPQAVWEAPCVVWRRVPCSSTVTGWIKSKTSPCLVLFHLDNSPGIFHVPVTHWDLMSSPAHSCISAATFACFTRIKSRGRNVNF